MATQNVCFYNKYGFCKYSEKCRNYHENKKCEKTKCEIKKCTLRHPQICKFFRDYGFCKFGEWCRFDHKVDKDVSENDEKIKELEDKLMKVENELENNNEKILRLEAELKDMHLKFSDKDQNVSKISKKYNVLKEKVTILFDLESKFDDLEKKVEKINLGTGKDSDKDSASQKLTPHTGEVKCEFCDFVAKNKFGLKIHIHKKHSTATFNCFTCDFTCETYSDLVEHNDTYYYSHRITLRKEYEKEILDEFQQLDEDGFLIHRKLDW